MCPNKALISYTNKTPSSSSVCKQSVCLETVKPKKTIGLTTKVSHYGDTENAQPAAETPEVWFLEIWGQISGFDHISQFELSGPNQVQHSITMAGPTCCQWNFSVGRWHLVCLNNLELYIKSRNQEAPKESDNQKPKKTCFLVNIVQVTLAAVYVLVLRYMGFYWKGITTAHGNAHADRNPKCFARRYPPGMLTFEPSML